MALRRLRAALLVSAACLAALPAAASANDDDDDNDWYEGTDAQPGRRRETWAHVFASRKTWSLTNGNTWAPSTTLEQDGIRLRLVSGLAGYRYTSRQYDKKTPDGSLVEHMGLKRTLDIMAGYQWSSGAWTFKAFGGVHGTMTLFRTHDPELPSKLKDRGAKGVFEAWYHISDRSWASLDLNYTTVERSYGARLRAGWMPFANFSVGPELHAIGNQNSRTERLGLFVRYDNGVHELSAAAGYDRTEGQPNAPYATAQYMYRF